MIEFHEIILSSNKKIDFIDITKQVKEILQNSKISNGIIIAYTQHTTTSLKISEWETEEDKALIKDSIEFLEKLASSSREYRHDKSNVDDRPNTHAHLKSLVLNSSEAIPFKNKELLLGKWQGLFLIEMDGPREKRKIILEIIGE